MRVSIGEAKLILLVLCVLYIFCMYTIFVKPFVPQEEKQIDRETVVREDWVEEPEIIEEQPNMYYDPNFYIESPYDEITNEEIFIEDFDMYTGGYHIEYELEDLPVY